MAGPYGPSLLDKLQKQGSAVNMQLQPGITQYCSELFLEHNTISFQIESNI